MGPQSYGRGGLDDTRLPRKASLLVHRPPVPQTDTGIRDENSKVLERFMAKELGKIDP